MSTIDTSGVPRTSMISENRHQIYFTDEERGNLIHDLFYTYSNFSMCMLKVIISLINTCFDGS